MYNIIIITSQYNVYVYININDTRFTSQQSNRLILILMNTFIAFNTIECEFEF